MGRTAQAAASSFRRGAGEMDLNEMMRASCLVRAAVRLSGLIGRRLLELNLGLSARSGAERLRDGLHGFLELELNLGESPTR